MKKLSIAPVLFALVAGCSSTPPSTTGTVPAPEPTTDSEPAPPPIATDAVGRAELNVLAAQLALPLFWVEDRDGDGRLDEDELAVLWGIDGTGYADWVKGGSFTPKFAAAYAEIRALKEGTRKAPDVSAEEQKRRELMVEELSGGQPTLVHNDFSSASAEDQAIVDHILAAAKIIEKIHLEQIGAWSLRDQVPADDPASKMVFHRNEGPWCVTPEVETDPACNAIPSKPEKVSGLYPASLQKKKDFCESLKKEKDAEKLRHQFHVVAEEGGKLKAVPYNVAYAEDMKKVSALLDQAAAAVTSPGEAAFKAYLSAAAKAFLDNEWEPADEAWAKMNAENSKWYLRIGPDEVYFEPCSLKGAFT